MGILDQIAEDNPICRMFWIDEPIHMDKDDYIYNPLYLDFECTKLLSNYEESDSSLRKRILERIGDES